MGGRKIERKSDDPMATRYDSAPIDSTILIKNMPSFGQRTVNKRVKIWTLYFQNDHWTFRMCFLLVGLSMWEKDLDKGSSCLFYYLWATRCIAEGEWEKGWKPEKKGSNYFSISKVSGGNMSELCLPCTGFRFESHCPYFYSTARCIS